MRLGHKAPDIPSKGIESDRDVPLQLFPADAARSFFQLNSAEIGQGNEGAGLVADFDVTDGFDAISIRFWKPHDEIEPLLAFIDAGRDLSPDGRRNDFTHISHIDSMTGDLAAVDIDGQIRLPV